MCAPGSVSGGSGDVGVSWYRCDVCDSVKVKSGCNLVGCVGASPGTREGKGKKRLEGR